MESVIVETALKVLLEWDEIERVVKRLGGKPVKVIIEYIVTAKDISTDEVLGGLLRAIGLEINMERIKEVRDDVAKGLGYFGPFDSIVLAGRGESSWIIGYSVRSIQEEVFMDLINEGKPLEEVDEHLLDLKEVIGDNDVKTLDMVVVPLNKGSVKAAADFLDKLNDALLSWRFNIVSKVFKVFTNKAPNKVKDGYALYRLDNDELNTLIVVYDIATLRDVLNELAGHSLLHIF